MARIEIAQVKREGKENRVGEKTKVTGGRNVGNLMPSRNGTAGERRSAAGARVALHSARLRARLKARRGFRRFKTAALQ